MFEAATALLSLAKAAGATTKQMLDLLSNGSVTKAAILDRTQLLREVLVAREDRRDPLVGSWTLFEWQTPENTRRAKGLYASSGNLSIFYRDPIDLSWHGLMTQVALPDENWKTTKGRSSPYSAAYKIALQMTVQGVCGTVELLPGLQYLRRADRLRQAFKGQQHLTKGEIFDGQLTGEGATASFQARYQTSTKTGVVCFRFIDHRPWSQVKFE